MYLPIHGTPFVFGRPESFNPTGMAMNTGADHSAMATLDHYCVRVREAGRLPMFSVEISEITVDDQK